MRLYTRKNEGKSQIVHYHLSLSRKMRVRGTTGIEINPDWLAKTDEEGNIILDEKENKIIPLTVSLPFSNPPGRGITKAQEKERELYAFIKHQEETLKDFKKNKTPQLDKALKDNFEVYFERKVDFGDDEHKDLYEYIDFLINNKIGVKKNTIDSYKRTKTILEEYQKAKKTTLTYEKIGMGFYARFVEYLRTKKRKDGVIGYGTNTIGKHIKNIKTFMNGSLIAGHHSSLKHKSKEFKILTEKSKAIYLDEDELKVLFNKEVKDKKDRAVLDYFLLMAFCGLRVGDTLKLRKKMIEEVDGVRMIVYEEGKNDDDDRAVYITPEMEVIIKRWNGFPNEKLKAKIHENYINTRIKVLAQEERLKKAKKITCHTGRRSFCTNEFLKPSSSKTWIMYQSGHKTEKDFNNYIKATGKKVISKLKAQADEKLK